MKFYECPHCTEFYATKQPLSVHIGKEHMSDEMKKRLGEYQ